MELTKMRSREVNACAEVAARAFFPYDYFTIFFPEDEQRMNYLKAIIASEYRANKRAANLLVLKENDKIISVAQLHAPNYKKPTDLQYFLGGFTRIYKTADKQTIDDWLAMDAQAGQPCHELAKDAWYLSSLVVDPEMQGKQYGTRMIEEHIIPFVKKQGGTKLSLFTNSEQNCRFYEKLGFHQFHSTTIQYNGQQMGSWAYIKEL